MRDEWLIRDGEFEDFRSSTEKPTLAVAGRIADCSCLDELEHVAEKYLDRNDRRQLFVYRRRKVQLQLRNVRDPDECLSLLRYLDDCVTESSGATEKAEYRDLWNEAVACLGNLSLVEADRLKFCALLSRTQEPLQAATGMLRAVLSELEKTSEAVSLAPVRLAVEREMASIKDSQPPVSFEEVRQRAERRILRRIPLAAMVPIGFGTILGALVLALIEHADTIWGWFYGK